MTDPLLLVDRDGAAALITLNRPEKRNALSIELRVLLAETLNALASDSEVAAIGVTGAGSAFCSGMDVSQFGGDTEHKKLIVDESIRAFQALARCPKPTVALVNGPTIAGGFALALMCDIRIAAPAARFGFPELGRYIPPSYAAAAWSLPPAVARDLCLTGRTLDAEEALVLGVVSRISPGREALDEVAAAPGPATAEIKRRILRHRAGAGADELMHEEEIVLRAALLGTTDG